MKSYLFFAYLICSWPQVTKISLFTLLQPTMPSAFLLSPSICVFLFGCSSRGQWTFLKPCGICKTSGQFRNHWERFAGWQYCNLKVYFLCWETAWVAGYLAQTQSSDLSFIRFCIHMFSFIKTVFCGVLPLSCHTYQELEQVSSSKPKHVA